MSLHFFMFSMVAFFGPLSPDPDFDEIKQLKKPKGVNKGIFQMAQGLHVLYGTHDLDHIEQLYDALGLIHKGAKKLEIGVPLPKLPGSYKKERELIRQDGFLRSVVFGNQALREAVNTSDPNQQLANLRRLFREQPDHFPTQIAICEALWAVGEIEAANTFAGAIAAAIPPEAFMPAALITAKLTRRTRSYKEAQAMLQQAAKITFGERNPARELSKQWDQELQAAKSDPAALYEMHVDDVLKGLAKNDPDALFYLAKIKRDNRAPMESVRLLSKLVKQKPDYFEALDLHYQIMGYQLSDPVDVRKLAKNAMKAIGEHPVLLTYSAIRNPHMSESEQRATLKKAIDMDATHLPAWREWFLLHRDASAEWYQAQQQKLIAANTDSVEALELMIRARLDAGHHEELDEVVVLAVSAESSTSDLVSKCLDAYPFLKDQDLKNRVILMAVHQASAFAALFQYYRAGAFAAKAAEVEPDLPHLSILAGNYYFQGGYRNISIDFYETAVAKIGGSAALFELIGDGYFDRDKMKKSIKAYRAALELDPQRPFPPLKIKEANKRINQKVKEGVLVALTVLAAGGHSGSWWNGWLFSSYTAETVRHTGSSKGFFFKGMA